MKLKLATCALVCLMMVLAAAGQASAAPTKTPTPTLKPIAPSPTTSYLYLRPTPTPFNITIIDYGINLSSDAGPVADNAINVYRAINHDHVIDFVMLGMVIIVVLIYLVKFIARSVKDN
jgi:hypothetical protein